MAEWWHETGTMHAHTWSLLARGVADRRAAARHPVLATVNPEGWADARTVVLRAASAESALLSVHSDAAAPKIAALEAEPRCTLLVWDPRAHLQIRLKARAQIRTGDAGLWARVPESARQVYGGTPPPGAPLQEPGDHMAEGALARFAVIDCVLETMDLLHLGADRHRRALYSRAEGWRGQWVAP